MREGEREGGREGESEGEREREGESCVYVCVGSNAECCCAQTRQVFRWILLARTLLHTERPPSSFTSTPVAGLRAAFRTWVGA